LKVVALSGGTGSAKLLRGLARLPIDLTVVCNVGDNFHWQGLLVCPDIDIAMYSLAGVADPERGWGIRGDTFDVLNQLGKMGEETWFRMGDRDMATSLLRTEMISRGASLTDVTDGLRKRYGLSWSILPASDASVETRIVTPGGNLHLQEFWVRDHGKGRVSGVEYRGAGAASTTIQAHKAIAGAERVVICPANPVTSIGPMLALGGMLEALGETSARIVALSPMRGGAPFSGPAGKLMRAVHVRPDSVGVAKLYSRFLDALIIDRRDSALKAEVESIGVSCVVSDITIGRSADAVRLAKEMIAA
jgi:LPPG:FO 2-phospho-L-lactate transferase